MPLTARLTVLLWAGLHFCPTFIHFFGEFSLEKSWIFHYRSVIPCIRFVEYIFGLCSVHKVNKNANEKVQNIKLTKTARMAAKELFCINPDSVLGSFQDHLFTNHKLVKYGALLARRHFRDFYQRWLRCRSIWIDWILFEIEAVAFYESYDCSDGVRSNRWIVW